MPVVFGGDSLNWIGRKIREFWATVQKDSNGEVHYATATVDIERGLVVWGLRVAAFEEGDDTPEEQAKAMADTLLVWSYQTGEVSTITLPTGLAAEALGMLPHDAGTMRLSGSSDADANYPEHPIYQWDEDSEDRQAAAVTLRVTQDRTGDTIVVAGEYPQYVTGTKAFIRTGDGKRIQWFGEIASVSLGGGNTTFTINTDGDTDHGATWYTGDRVVLGVVPMRLVTNRVHVGETRLQNGVTGVVVTSEVLADHAFARVTVTDERSGVSFFTDRFGSRLRNGVQGFPYGHWRGDDMVVDVWVWADGRVNIKDISVEVQVDDIA